jgi:hypothetical protein
VRCASSGYCTEEPRKEAKKEEEGEAAGTFSLHPVLSGY